MDGRTPWCRLPIAILKLSTAAGAGRRHYRRLRQPMRTPWCPRRTAIPRFSLAGAGFRRRSEQNQVVAVDQFALIDVAERRFDFGRWLAENTLRFRHAVVDQAASDLTAIDVETADNFAALESTLASRYPNRQQALAFTSQRPHRAGVQRQPAFDADVIGEPLLTCSEGHRFGNQLGADHFARGEPGQHVRLAPVGDDRRCTTARRAF